ncbi:MAG: DNA polymerase III subunit gamma/tau, partial [Pseudomonadota bacterium]
EQADSYSDDPIPDMRDALFKLTGKRWVVERGTGEAQPSLREAADAEAQATRDRIRSHPLVQAALDAFPTSELIDPDDNVTRTASGGRNWN